MEDVTTPLNEAMEYYQQIALNEFVKKFLMPALNQYGRWNLEHLVKALADYALVRPDWELVVKHLENAAHEISHTRHI